MTSNTSMNDAPSFAFYGYAGAGKTTCAEFLVKQYGLNKLSFAAPLKEIAVMLWGEEAFKDRGKLQALGTMLRQIDEDVWVNPLMRQVEAAAGPMTVDDCRFPNEYWRLKEAGFTMVRVIADEATRIDRLMRNGKLQEVDQLNHESETALTSDPNIVPDFTIVNRGTLEEALQVTENTYEAVKEGI